MLVPFWELTRSSVPWGGCLAAPSVHGVFPFLETWTQQGACIFFRVLQKPNKCPPKRKPQGSNDVSCVPQGPESSK